MNVLWRDDRQQLGVREWMWTYVRAYLLLVELPIATSFFYREIV